ncbi:MAG TPA: glycosyltransferase family 2 protein [Cytophagales bacterium]|nr:glycosyltransferase family 2 protein [Cytophagales bacterium]
MIFFSIIMPTYNRAHFITHAIQSVLKQSFANWELIIVDDGSTDTTQQVLQEYLGDQRITYLYQSNQERSAARNQGIRMAKGKFICFLDSDDYYLSNHLDVLHQYIQIHMLGAAFLYTQPYREHNKVRRLNVPFEKITNNGIYNILFEGLLDINSVCISKTCLEEDLFPEQFFLFEDNHLWLRILSKYPFYYIPTPTTVAVEHPQRTVNVTAQNLLSKEKMYFDAVNHLISHYPYVKVSSKEWNKFKALKKLTLAFEALHTKNIKFVYKFVFESIFIHFIPSKIDKYFKLITLSWVVKIFNIKT